MFRLGLLVCVVVICTQVGNIRGECTSTQCNGNFDDDFMVTPNQTCYDDGAVVVLVCQGILNGPPSPPTCSSGVWTPPLPECLYWICNPPTVGDGITLTPDNPTYGMNEVVKYSCPPGQNPTLANATCDANMEEEIGQWNPAPVPQCIAVCITPSITNGNVTSEGPFIGGSNYDVECYPGFTIPAGGTTSITCDESGNWVALPTCVGGCTLPATPNSNYLEDSEVGHESTRTIQCDVGYSFDQETSFEVTCNNGNLEGTLPTECYKDCDPLAPPMDGSITGGSLHGETTTYACNRGYLLNSTETETCDNGTWSAGGVTPTCHNRELENSISLICDPGYFIVEIPLGLFTDRNLNSVEMNGCPATSMDAEWLFLNSSYTDCGTTLTVDAGNSELIYRNTIRTVDSGQVTIEQRLVVNIECVFDQNKRVSSSAVMQDTLMRDVQADGQYSMSFTVWADATYVTPITAMDSVDTNSDIFLKAQVNNVQQLDVYPVICYATPTAADTDTSTFDLIRDGESFSAYVSNLNDDDQDGKPTFSFASKAFRFSSHESQSIFIHCNLKICPDGTCPLPGGGSRRRRAMKDTQLTVTKHVFAGPIVIRQTRETEGDAGQTTALTIYSAVISMLMVCGIGLVAVVGIFYHRSKKNQQV